MKYSYNFDVFTNEDDISYYLLGAFITDGCIYKNNPTTYAAQLSSADKDWLNDIKNIIGNNLNLHQFRDNYWGIRIIRKNIAQWFIDHGCNSRKTLTITMPNVPEQYLPDFIRGCIDGDGSIGIYDSKKSVALTSASLIFLQEIQNILNAKNIKSSLCEKKQKTPSLVNNKLIIQKNKCYQLNLNAIHSFNLLNWIYYPNHKLSLLRKNIKAQEIINYYNSLNGKSALSASHLGKNTKIDWPVVDELISEIKNTSLTLVASRLGIARNSIINYLKRRNIPKTEYIKRPFK